MATLREIVRSHQAPIRVKSLTSVVNPFTVIKVEGGVGTIRRGFYEERVEINNYPGYDYVVDEHHLASE